MKNSIFNKINTGYILSSILIVLFIIMLKKYNLQNLEKFVDSESDLVALQDFTTIAIKGPKGDEGNKGSVGPQGERGTKGTRGYIGPKGEDFSGSIISTGKLSLGTYNQGNSGLNADEEIQLLLSGQFKKGANNGRKDHTTYKLKIEGYDSTTLSKVYPIYIQDDSNVVDFYVKNKQINDLVPISETYVGGNLSVANLGSIFTSNIQLGANNSWSPVMNSFPSVSTDENLIKGKAQILMSGDHDTGVNYGGSTKENATYKLKIEGYNNENRHVYPIYCKDKSSNNADFYVKNRIEPSSIPTIYIGGKIQLPHHNIVSTGSDSSIKFRNGTQVQTSNAKIECGPIKATGQVQCTTINATEQVTCGPLTATGQVQCTTINATGQVTCGPITTNGQVSCGPLTAIGQVDVMDKLKLGEFYLKGDTSTTGWLNLRTGLSTSGYPNGKLQLGSLKTTGQVTCGSITATGPITATGQVDVIDKLKLGAFNMKGDTYTSGWLYLRNGTSTSGTNYGKMKLGQLWATGQVDVIDKLKLGAFNMKGDTSTTGWLHLRTGTSTSGTNYGKMKLGQLWASQEVTITDKLVLGSFNLKGSTSSSGWLNLNTGTSTSTTNPGGKLQLGYLKTMSNIVAGGNLSVGNGITMSNNQKIILGTYTLGGWWWGMTCRRTDNVTGVSDGKLWIGELTVNEKLTSSGTVVTSDVRLKKNICNLTNNLYLISKLSPKKYIKKPNINKISYGFIAQEVEKIIPNLVTIDNKNELNIKDLRTLDYNGLIPICVGAIQEQQKTITNLEARIKRLESLILNRT